MTAKNEEIELEMPNSLRDKIDNVGTFDNFNFLDPYDFTIDRNDEENSTRKNNNIPQQKNFKDDITQEQTRNNYAKNHLK